MADKTKIEWTDATWNPITGCAVVSPGCANCYAMKLAGTRLRHIPSRAGLTQDTKAGPVWNGQVRFNEEWIHQPMNWRRPRRIFVCAHGDLFAENVPDEWIHRVYAVMSLAPQHVFQVLTKRPERMRSYLRERYALPPEVMAFYQDDDGNGLTEGWQPPRNVWHGVSVEDQRRADERLEILRSTPSAVRWISAEPLLGPIETCLRGIDWVVAGGESGPGARPMHLDWARSLRDQCVTAGIPFLFKQWGEYLPAGQVDALGVVWNGRHENGRPALVRYGKKLAGRSLDGVTHDAFPKAA